MSTRIYLKDQKEKVFFKTVMHIGSLSLYIYIKKESWYTTSCLSLSLVCLFYFYPISVFLQRVIKKIRRPHLDKGSTASRRKGRFCCGREATAWLAT